MNLVEVLCRRGLGHDGSSRAVEACSCSDLDHEWLLRGDVLRLEVGEEVGVLIAWLFRILTTAMLEVGERIDYLAAC